MKKINFQDLPNTDTPIKASTLNTMQSNIEESCVAVSPTQPETGEMVWIQKGKNLCDGLNEIGNIDTETGLNIDSSDFVRTVNYAKVKPQTTYTFKIDRLSNQIVVYYYNYNTLLSFEFTSNTDTYVFTTPENCNRVRFRISTPVLIEQCQLEEGSVATEYEGYVNKKINIDNEEFLDVEKINNQQNYSTEEQVIGTWIDGKPLYRKIVTYKNTETIGSSGSFTNISIPHNITNLGLVINHHLIMSKSGNMQYMFPAYNGDSTLKKGTVISEIHATNILMRIINDTWNAGKTFYIILEYTKTTD